MKIKIDCLNPSLNLCKSILTVIVLSVLLLTSVSSSFAQSNKLYMVCEDGSLYVSDEANCTNRLIANVTLTINGNFYQPYDVAVCPNGKLYICLVNTIGDTTYFCEVDSASGVVTPIPGCYSSDILGTVNALTADKNCNLYGANAITISPPTSSSYLLLINPTTATVTIIGDIGYASSGDLTFYNGILYLCTIYSQLVTVNTSTGAGTLVGTMTHNGNTIQNAYGICTLQSNPYDTTTRYMIVSTDSGNYQVNPTTAVCTALCLNTVSSDIYGAASLAENSSNVVGISEKNSDNSFAIYPVPATNTVTIENSQRAVIEITNLQGQLIQTITTRGNKTNIDISSFPNGVYIVEMKTDEGIVVRKIVKE
jgi:hypothetical protein